MVQFEICSGTGPWARFTTFYVEHRTRIIPAYKVSRALTDVKNYIKHGRGAILKDEADRVVGIGCFVLGLQEQGFDHKEIAVLGNCYFEERFRSNRTFVRGLQVLAQQIGEASADVKEVRIPAEAGNAYTNRMYQKMAERTHSFETEYGTFHTYAMPFERFVGFSSRFR